MLDVDIEKIIPVTEARDSLNDIIAKVENTDELYVITKNGKPSAILVGVNHLEKLTGMSHEELMPDEDIGSGAAPSGTGDDSGTTTTPTTTSATPADDTSTTNDDLDPFAEPIAPAPNIANSQPFDSAQGGPATAPAPMPLDNAFTAPPATTPPAADMIVPAPAPAAPAPAPLPSSPADEPVDPMTDDSTPLATNLNNMAPAPAANPFQPPAGQLDGLSDIVAPAPTALPSDPNNVANAAPAEVPTADVASTAGQPAAPPAQSSF